MYHHSINVSQATGKTLFGSNEPQYVHFFRVELDTTYATERKQEILRDIAERFPAPGFKVTVSRSQPHVSERVDTID